MISEGIRDYVSREWQRARDAKDAFWAERIARLGSFEGFRIADELRRQVVEQHPDWPGEEQRAEDLASHLRLAELFRRAGRACSD